MINFANILLKNKVGQTIPLKMTHIKISKAFAHATPSPTKLLDKYKYYRQHKTFSSPIIVDQSGMLVDGYTSYLLAKMFSVKQVPVTIIHNEVKQNR